MDADPKPMKDDPCFNGDYNLFRKRYKAWAERDRRKRARHDASESAAAVPPPASEMPAAQQHPKPRGHVPQADGLPCSWDGDSGCWRTASGHEHHVDREAQRAAFFGEKAAERAEEQQLRRAEVEQIDTEAIRRVRAAYAATPAEQRPWPRDPVRDNPSGPSTGRVVTYIRVPPTHSLHGAMTKACTETCGGFSPCMNAAAAIGASLDPIGDGHALFFRRSNEYWSHAYELALDTMTCDQFDFHIGDVLLKQGRPVLREMTAAAKRWSAAIAVKPPTAPRHQKHPNALMGLSEVRALAIARNRSQANFIKSACEVCGALLESGGVCYRLECRVQVRPPQPWCARCAEPVEPPEAKEMERLRLFGQWLVCGACREKEVYHAC